LPCYFRLVLVFFLFVFPGRKSEAVRPWSPWRNLRHYPKASIKHRVFLVAKMQNESFFVFWPCNRVPQQWPVQDLDFWEFWDAALSSLLTWRLRGILLVEAGPVCTAHLSHVWFVMYFARCPGRGGLRTEGLERGLPFINKYQHQLPSSHQQEMPQKIDERQTSLNPTSIKVPSQEADAENEPVCVRDSVISGNQDECQPF